jgi:hypothetical protein
MVRRAPLWSGGHIAERTMILRVGRTVVCALAKQLNKEMGSEGDQKAVEIASSPESLSMAADDFADAMQNARRAIGILLRPNRANAESQCPASLPQGRGTGGERVRCSWWGYWDRARDRDARRTTSPSPKYG